MHVFSDFGKFCYTINKKSDRIAKFGFYFRKGDGGVLDNIMENAGDDCVFIHVPFFEDFFDSKRMDYVGFAGATKLVFVSFFGKFDGFRDSFGVLLLLVHGLIIAQLVEENFVV